jgi:hypothetical protein
LLGNGTVTRYNVIAIAMHNKQIKTEELLEAVLSTESDPRIYSELPSAVAINNS